MIGGRRAYRPTRHRNRLRCRFQIDGRGKLHFIRELHPVRRIVVHGVAKACNLGACNLDRCRQPGAERNSRDIEIAGRSDRIERETVAGSERRLISRRTARAVCGGIPVRGRKPIQIPAIARPIPSRRIHARRRKRNYRGEEKTKCFLPPPPGLC